MVDNLEEMIVTLYEGGRIGTATKKDVHEHGIYHEAVSLVIFDSRGRMLIQKRNPEKYHSGGLWSNSCCGHPLENESSIKAAHRKLHHELNTECELEYAFTYDYKVQFSNGLIENEKDHVFVGISDELPIRNEDEVVAVGWMAIDELKRDIERNPHIYAEWFKIMIKEHGDKLIESYQKQIAGR